MPEKGLLNHSKIRNSTNVPKNSIAILKIKFLYVSSYTHYIRELTLSTITIMFLGVAVYGPGPI